MHIGVDATCWHNRRGYGRHARALLNALVPLDAENDYTLVMDADPEGPLPQGAHLKVVRTSRPTVTAAAADGRRSVGDLWRMSRALSQSAFDLVLFPTIYSYVPVASRAKKIVVIHDVIAERFPQLTQPNRAARLFWQAKVGLGRRQADAIVTVSDYSRQCLLDLFQLDPARLFVVGEASDPVFRVLEHPQPTPGLRELGIMGEGRLVLYVGGFGPHKNLERLVRAFGEIAADPAYSDARLVMVGEYKREAFYGEYETLRALVEASGLTRRLIFTGFMPDAELVTLLNLGTVLVLPSLMEGFGLPAVEGAACGLPVIATAASPLPGLLGEGGLYVDPEDEQGLAQALSRVLGSRELRERMSRAALAHARALNWEAAAQQMREVVREVAA